MATKKKSAKGKAASSKKPSGATKKRAAKKSAKGKAASSKKSNGATKKRAAKKSAKGKSMGFFGKIKRTAGKVLKGAAAGAARGAVEGATEAGSKATGIAQADESTSKGKQEV